MSIYFVQFHSNSEIPCDKYIEKWYKYSRIVPCVHWVILKSWFIWSSLLLPGNVIRCLREAGSQIFLHKFKFISKRNKTIRLVYLYDCPVQFSNTIPGLVIEWASNQDDAYYISFEICLQFLFWSPCQTA